MLKSGQKCVVAGTPGRHWNIHVRILFEPSAAERRYYGDLHLHGMGVRVAICTSQRTPGQTVLETLRRLDVTLPKPDDAGWVGRFISNGATELAQESKELYGGLTKLEGEVVVLLDPPPIRWGADVFKNPPCGMLVVTSSTSAIHSSHAADAFRFCMPL